MKSLITKKDLNFTDCKVFDVKNFRNYVIFSLVSLTLRLLVVKSRMSSYVTGMCLKIFCGIHRRNTELTLMTFT